MNKFPVWLRGVPVALAGRPPSPRGCSVPACFPSRPRLIANRAWRQDLLGAKPRPRIYRHLGPPRTAFARSRSAGGGGAPHLAHSVDFAPVDGWEPRPESFRRLRREQVRAPVPLRVAHPRRRSLRRPSGPFGRPHSKPPRTI